MRALYVLMLLLWGNMLLAQDKEDPCPLPASKKARKLYEQALDAIKTDKNEARNLLREAVEIEPDFGRANLVLADLLVKMKKPAEAEVYYQSVARLCPELEPMVFYRLGSIAFEAKKWKDAEKNLQIFVDSRSRKEAEKSEARTMIKACQFYISGYANPVPFNPSPLDAISSAADEYLPVITPDQELAYFTRSTFVEDKFTGGINTEKKRVEKFCVSKVKPGTTQMFEAGNPMPMPFNNNNNEGGASLTADNQLMFFTICKNEGGEGLNCDLYYSVFQNGTWSEIRNAGPAINGKTSWESQPSLSSDGKILYFASSREGGLGGLDIWKSVRDAKGQWSLPVNLGPEINTPGNEKSPFFHSDGQTLYFSSTGHMGFGGYDIFMSKLGKDGVWATPKNIGYPINSENDDLGFFVSTDGKHGYFASDKLKGNGGWDVYSFDLYKEVRPERVLFLSGALKDENNQVISDAKVELRNTRTKEVTSVKVDSATGKYVAVVAFDEDHILTVQQPGKAFTSQYFSVKDSTIDRPMKVDMKVEALQVGKPYKLNNIQFNTSSSMLSRQTLVIIDELTRFLKSNPNVKIAIQGHTDNVGNPADNMKLSEARAKVIFDVLILNGIKSDRLTYKGFGSTKPVASNLTEKGKAMNRRTEFTITAK